LQIAHGWIVLLLPVAGFVRYYLDVMRKGNVTSAAQPTESEQRHARKHQDQRYLDPEGAAAAA